MSIRTTANFSTSPLDAFTDALDDFNTIVEQTAQETVNAYREPIKQRLGEIPGPVKLPVEWTSERQRRAYFATDGFGNGIPYRRTNDLPQGWEVYAIVEAGTVAMIIRNPSKAAKFVYGPLGASSNPNFKQAMHRNTGWLDAKPIVDIFAVSMINFFSDTLRTRLGASVSSTRRAYTGR